MKSILSVLFFSIFSYCALSQNATLTITVKNFANNTGTAKIAVYSEEFKNDFLSNPKRAVQKKEAKIVNQNAKFVFKDLPYGVYAVAVQHDENNDGIFNRAVIGFPIEGYGISGNETIFGKPDFDDCDFRLDSESKNLVIEMKYFKL